MAFENYVFRKIYDTVCFRWLKAQRNKKDAELKETTEVYGW